MGFHRGVLRDFAAAFGSYTDNRRVAVSLRGIVPPLSLFVFGGGSRALHQLLDTTWAEVQVGLSTLSLLAVCLLGCWPSSAGAVARQRTRSWVTSADLHCRRQQPLFMASLIVLITSFLKTCVRTSSASVRFLFSLLSSARLRECTATPEDISALHLPSPVLCSPRYWRGTSGIRPQLTLASALAFSVYTTDCSMVRHVCTRWCFAQHCTLMLCGVCGHTQKCGTNGCLRCFLAGPTCRRSLPWMHGWCKVAPTRISTTSPACWA